MAAVRGVLSSVLGMLDDGATHVGVATDHVIESFRNDMWPGYKTSAGVDPTLLAQFDLLEIALYAMGVTVWPMVKLEADDALASAAAVAAADPAVDQVVICTPDKDLGQCVVGSRVVQMDRRKGLIIDEAGVRAKFGVGPGFDPRLSGPGGRQRRTAFPGSRGGAPRPRRRCWPATSIWKRYPTSPENGTCPFGGSPVWRSRWRPNGIWPCCSGTWRPCGPRRRRWTASRILRWAGPRPEFGAAVRRRPRRPQSGRHGRSRSGPVASRPAVAA